MSGRRGELQSTGPHSIVHLAFDDLAGTPTRFGGPDLTALRPGDGKVYLVIFYVSEQGNSWTSYLKCESDCPVPSPPPTGLTTSPRGEPVGAP